MRFAPLLLSTLSLPLCALPALADDRGASRAPASTEAPPRLEFTPLLSALGLKGSDSRLASGTVWDTYDAYYAAGVEIDVRVTPRVGLGGYVASWQKMGSGDAVTVVAPEAKYHLTPRAIVDLWGSAQLGFAVANAVAPHCGDCGYLDPSVRAPRFAPLTGVGLGIDLCPVPWLSVGVEGRAFATLFDRVKPNNDSVPSSIATAGSLGLRLGVRLPL